MQVAATAAAWLAHLRTALSATLWALGWVLSAGYLVTIPLRYSLYYAFRFVLVLLSPVRWVFGVVASAADLVLDFAARFKLACGALVGILAGCALHGTSNFIFVLLGVDGSSEKEKGRRRRLRASSLSTEGSEDDGVHEVDGGLEQRGFWSGDGSTTLSSSRSRRPNKGKGSGSSSSILIKGEPAALDYSELLDSRWKQLNAAEKPGRRRRRGLLAQTIHEESSESDSS